MMREEKTNLNMRRRSEQREEKMISILSVSSVFRCSNHSVLIPKGLSGGRALTHLKADESADDNFIAQLFGDAADVLLD